MAWDAGWRVGAVGLREGVCGGVGNGGWEGLEGWRGVSACMMGTFWDLERRFVKGEDGEGRRMAFDEVRDGVFA